MFDWLFGKSYKYLVLINYDRSFAVSRELLDAICSYPANSFKPHKYNFLTKKYNDIEVPAKSISKVKFSSLISVSLDFESLEGRLDWHPLLSISDGSPKGYNEVFFCLENVNISKFISYIKHFFHADYGFVCKCKNKQNACVGSVVWGKNSSWHLNHKKVCEGFLKDVYPVNILNSTHVQNALIDKIKEDERMGEIDSSVDGYLIWNVDPSNIRYARRVCKKMGLLI